MKGDFEEKYGGFIIVIGVILMVVVMVYLGAIVMGMEEENAWIHYCNEVLLGDNWTEGYNIQKVEEYCR